MRWESLGRRLLEVILCPSLSLNRSICLQECSDNGLGSFNNVVTVTKRDFDVYFETQELTSPEKGIEYLRTPLSYEMTAY